MHETELAGKKISQLSVRELFAILKARETVFVVEQNCPYHEIDNHDPDILHVFATDEHERIAADARIFREEDVGQVMQQIEQMYPGVPVKIEAQDYIQSLYAHFGFTRVSENTD